MTKNYTSIDAFQPLWDEVPELKSSFLETVKAHNELIRRLGGQDATIVADLLPADKVDQYYPYMEIYFFTPHDRVSQIFNRAICKSSSIYRPNNDKYSNLSAMALAVHTAVYFFTKFKIRILDGILLRDQTRPGEFKPEKIEQIRRTKNVAIGNLALFPTSVKNGLDYKCNLVYATNVH